MAEPNVAEQASSTSTPVRVLVVDDSAFMRFTISKYLAEAPGIAVVGSARDGREALELIPKYSPDVITLDVEMPYMDGLSTLREIMTRFPRPVVMLSSLTKEGAWETIQALTLGAVDFATKPDTKANIGAVMSDVIVKVRRAAQAKVFGLRRLSDQALAAQTLADSELRRAGFVKRTRPMTAGDKVLVIGSSTGGPRALNTVVPELSEKMNAAVIIVQHMPAGFTRSLAERLDNISKLAVREAVPGDTLEVGRALVAPGGFHLRLDENHQVALNQSPPVHGVRPSVDVTMTSVVEHFGSSVVGVILTGMGMDGTNGAALIHSAGGWVIAEDESTCVVWGMPRSVVEAGVSNEIVPLPDISTAIHRAVGTVGTGKN